MDDSENSLGGGATYAGATRPPLSGQSLGDQETLGDHFGDGEAVFDGFEVVDLEARYKVESSLGRGGMGEVLLALDTRLDRRVAIKRILGEAARSKTAVERFLTEAKALAKLNHPNIVQIYECGYAKDGPFLVMEYVGGSSLLERCSKGALELEEAIGIACQLCDGLARAHDEGIVHRDIKPANILLTKDGEPKLTDFGLAKANTADSQMTMAGTVLGTPDFMPPEQRRDAAEVDARSDLWSLAATLYQMVTGRSPKIIRFKEVPAALEEILGKALEESKNERFQTARELRDALNALHFSEKSATADLGEGQCPSCGLRNEASRRFCRGCAASLEAPCLSCGRPIPMWEEVCGQCGEKQSSLMEARLAEKAVRQAQAESLLKEYEFGQAEELVRQLQDDSDPRFRQLSQWAARFRENIEEARKEQLSKTRLRLEEALKHEAVGDYAAAVDALALVPESLREQSAPGHSESLATVLARVKTARDRVADLENSIAARIRQKEFGGLLEDDVAELCRLCPGNGRYEKLAAQLRERREKLRARQAELLAQAKVSWSQGDYRAVLHKITPSDLAIGLEEVVDLCEAAKVLVEVLQEIRVSIESKAFDGLLPKVEKAIALDPAEHDLQKLRSLRSQLRQKEEQDSIAASKWAQEARDAFQKCQFAEAVNAIEKIPGRYLGSEISDLRASAELLAESRADFDRNFAKLPHQQSLAANGDAQLEFLVSRGESYLSVISKHGLRDEEVESALGRLKAAYATQKKSRVWSTVSVTAVLVGAVVVIALTTMYLIQLMRARSESSGGAVGEVFAENGLETNGAGTARVFEETHSSLEGRVTREGDRASPSIVVNSVGMELREIPPGKFVMGDPLGQINEQPHDVEVSRGFYIGSTEVTNQQWIAVMGDSPAKNQSLKAPVEKVNWQEANEFCQLLSQLPEEVASGRVYRLPSEVEWEYACRGGATTKWAFGDDAEKVSRMIWHAGNANGVSHVVAKLDDTESPSEGSFAGYRDRIHRYQASSGGYAAGVVNLRTNAVGLWQMHGNVAEWCDDIYVENLGSNGNVDAVLPGFSERVVRGGGFTSTLNDCRAAFRSKASETTRRSDIGFRVVMVLP